MYVSLLVVLSLLRVFGPVQNLFTWGLTFTFLVNTLLVIVFALTVKNLLDRVIQDKTFRRIAGHILFVGTAIMVFFIFQDELVAASISLGIVAGVLIFVFQAPLLNIIGWVYLVTGQVYSVGDRIQIGNIKGDIVHINPIRTKVQEVGGEYVQADLVSGRLYTFPNSLLLTEPVSNYTKHFPYIWVDLFFHLTYETDFPFVMKKIDTLILQYLGEEGKSIEEGYKKLLNSFGQHKDSVTLVNFNLVSFQSWIELRVTFPLNPKQQSEVTTEVMQRILKMFKKYPEKVKFPKGRAR